MRWVLIQTIFLSLFGLWAVACSSGPGASTTTNPASEDTGQIGVQLTLPGGEEIDSVTWEVLSNGAVVQRGVVNLAETQTISFVVGGIPAGMYIVTVTGTSTDGAAVCIGSGTVVVASRQTAPATIFLQCSTAAADAGLVALQGITNPCATLQSVSASPTEITVGGSVQLVATAAGPDPSSLTYQWSAPSGTFSNPTAAATTFTSSTPGPVTLTLVVGDGPVAPGFVCSAALDTSTLPITVDPLVTAGGPQSVIDCNQTKSLIALATSDVCTNTELALFDKSPSCLSCMFGNGCLDDSEGDQDQECEDSTSEDECLDVLECDIGVAPSSTPGTAPAAGNVLGAYCGPSTSLSVCEAAPIAALAPGVCAGAIAAGFPGSPSASQVVTNFTTKNEPAGYGNAMVACAEANGCASCTATTAPAPNCATVTSLTETDSSGGLGSLVRGHVYPWSASALTFSVQASAPEPSALNYTWWAFGGTLSATTGASVVFTPFAIPANLGVTAADGPGGPGVACDPNADTFVIALDILTPPPVIDAGSESDSAGPLTLQQQCNQNKATQPLAASPICTATELSLFERDTSGGCLSCLLDAGCIDDNAGDIHQECDDLTGTSQAECLATLDCELGVTDYPTLVPPPAAGNPDTAYCGNISLTDCAAASPDTAAPGACAAPIAAGFPSSFTSAQVLQSFSNVSYASGVAGQVVSCGDLNKCKACGL